MTYTVYAIRCTETGRVYVGSTKDLEQRVYSHFGELSRGEKKRHANASRDFSPTEWQRDYDLYGRSAFKVYVLEEGLTSDNRADKEEYWIAKYKAADPAYGYNCRSKVRRDPFQIEQGVPPLPLEEDNA